MEGIYIVAMVTVYAIVDNLRLFFFLNQKKNEYTHNNQDTK